MEANNYQEEAKKTIVDFGSLHRDDKHLINSVMGLSSEVGEITQLVQRWKYCGKPLSKEHMLLECGDALWYISYILTSLGLTLDKCMEENIKKVHKRYQERVENYESWNG